MARSDLYGSANSQSILSDYKGKEIKSLVSDNSADVNDVVRDYDWTYSLNRRLREEVPYVQLKEFKLAGNSYVASMISSSFVFEQGVKSIPVDISQGAKNIKDKVKDGDSLFSKFIGKMADGVSNVSDFVADKASGSIVEFALKQFGAADNTAEGWSAYTKNDDLKNNYQYMYIRMPTNRSYILPYFSDDFFSQSNSFTDTMDGGGTYATGALAKGAEYAEALGRNIDTFDILKEPGMYVERPKFYGFNGDGKEFTIEFTLFNTIRENEYLRNLELLTKLILQNTPHRVNRILVDPPCLYELFIPGRGFYPYTYISSLEVSHLGTRRYLAKLIVPDAFKVTIKLKSLIMETNNLIAPGMGTPDGIDISKRYTFENKQEVAKAIVVAQPVTTPKDSSEATETD